MYAKTTTGGPGKGRELQLRPPPIPLPGLDFPKQGCSDLYQLFCWYEPEQHPSRWCGELRAREQMFTYSETPAGGLLSHTGCSGGNSSATEYLCRVEDRIGLPVFLTSSRLYLYIVLLFTDPSFNLLYRCPLIPTCGYRSCRYRIFPAPPKPQQLLLFLLLACRLPSLWASCL